MTAADVPALNALLNATATVLICLGFLLVRNGRVRAHRACMIAALLTSCLFLVGYVGHKIAVQGVHTVFGGTGTIRTVYYLMLATHVVLAMVIVPLVLVTFRFAIRGQFERHKRWARWTFPIWLYVSVTGVLVYLFLYRWYPAAEIVGGAG